MSFPPQTGFKPQLTVRKLINNSILSPTFLQIYCIELIGLILQFFWVWATFCDPTYIYIYIKFSNNYSDFNYEKIIAKKIDYLFFQDHPNLKKIIIIHNNLKFYIYLPLKKNLGTP